MGIPNDPSPILTPEGNKWVANISGFNPSVNNDAISTMKVIGISISNNACLRDKPILNLQQATVKNKNHINIIDVMTDELL